MPKSLLSPEEVASILRIEPADVLALIDDRVLRGYKIGSVIRVAEDDLDRCLESCAVGREQTQDTKELRSATAASQPQHGERLCRTFAGRTTFRVSGHVDTGAQIWPGDMRYPISFPKDKMDALLAHGRSLGEMRVGASFGGPEDGSLGQWIQEKLPTRLSPATYVAGLLIEEGYAERASPGLIRFFPKRKA